MFKGIRSLCPVVVVLGRFFCGVSQASSPSACEPATIVGADYPRHARAARIEGEVKVTVKIAANGKITDIVGESGHPVLLRVVIAEINRWSFRPAPRESSGCDELLMVWRFKLEGYCETKCTSSFVVDYPNRVTIASQITALQP